LFGLKDTPWAHVVEKFQRKKNSFVVSCPESLCCQNTQFGPLGVKLACTHQHPGAKPPNILPGSPRQPSHK